VRSRSLFHPGYIAIVAALIYGLLKISAKVRIFREWISDTLVQFGFPHFGELTILMIMGTIVGSMGGITVALSNLHKRRNQLLRDTSRQDDEAFALLLRPFYIDTKPFLKNPFDDLVPGLGDQHLRVEEYVARALEPLIGVREFAGRNSSISGARILAGDATWRIEFDDEASKASMFVIVPLLDDSGAQGSSAGTETLYELEYLARHDFLSKTIAIMPPTPKFAKYNGRKTECEWERARLASLAFNVHLPAYSSDGGVLLFANSGQSWAACSIPFPKRKFFQGMEELHLAALVCAAKVVSEANGIRLREPIS
jgi:hypothetical protein